MACQVVGYDFRPFMLTAYTSQSIFANAPEQRNIGTVIWRFIAVLRHSPDTDRSDYHSTSMGFILIPDFSSPHSVAV
ncbi:MAG: hypothetical protein K2J32_04845 [Ruminococcus sp.]|nr:hypothetical protein [Ruminococcus sp.]